MKLPKFITVLGLLIFSFNVKGQKMDIPFQDSILFQTTNDSGRITSCILYRKAIAYVSFYSDMNVDGINGAYTKNTIFGQKVYMPQFQVLKIECDDRTITTTGKIFVQQ